MNDEYATAINKSITTGTLAKNRSGWRCIYEHCAHILGDVQIDDFKHGSPRLPSEVHGWTEKLAIQSMLILKEAAENDKISFTKYYNAKKVLGVIARLQNETWGRVAELYDATKLPEKADTAYKIGKGYMFPLKKPDFKRLIFQQYEAGDLLMFVIGKVLVCIHLLGLRPCDAASVFKYNTLLGAGATWGAWKQDRHKSNKQTNSGWKLHTICTCGGGPLNINRVGIWTSCFHCCMTWLHIRCPGPQLLRRQNKKTTNGSDVSSQFYGKPKWQVIAMEYFEACDVEPLPLCTLRKGFAAMTERAAVNFVYVREVVDDTYKRWKSSYSPDAIRGNSDAMVGGEQSESFADCTAAVRQIIDWLRSDLPTAYDLQQPSLHSIQNQLVTMTGMFEKLMRKT